MLQYRSDHFLFAAFTLVPMLSSCMPYAFLLHAHTVDTKIFIYVLFRHSMQMDSFWKTVQVWAKFIPAAKAFNNVNIVEVSIACLLRDLFSTYESRDHLSSRGNLVAVTRVGHGCSQTVASTT